MGRAMLNVCDAKKTKGIYKIGYLFAFLGSGTECRCCLGMRIALAFGLGMLMGFLALYNLAIAITVLVTFTSTVALFFIIWVMWSRNQDDYADDYTETIEDGQSYTEGTE